MALTSCSWSIAAAPCLVSRLPFTVAHIRLSSGSAIRAVRDTLQLLLRALPARCLFNIVSFGSTHSSLFQSSRPYSNETMREAAAHVASMEANLGGTELLAPMRFVLQSARRATHPRQVFVLTGGCGFLPFDLLFCCY